MLINIPKNKDKTILEYMREQQLFVDAPCNGLGVCKKCTVDILAEDNNTYTTVLACETKCDTEITIKVEETQNKILTTFNAKNIQGTLDGYGVAVDIGTTTIVMVLIDNQGKIVNQHSVLNEGRMYGADVISRIAYATENGTESLHQSLVNQLEQGFDKLCTEISPTEITHMVISGNTTMLHILENEPCHTLGVSPFEPIFINARVYPITKLMPAKPEHIQVTLVAGFSTYVGADILSGVFALDMEKSEKINLLVDIGTNGEMIIGNMNGLIGLATAAGPAFEGSGIEYGMPAHEGAIYKIEFKDGKLHYKTIGNVAPKGLCGSAIIDLISIGVEQEWVDETGFCEEDIQVTDTIVLTQKDIRQIQLAKSAIRSGIQVLIEASNIQADEIDTIYIAGGFGTYIDLENACKINLLPQAFLDKIQLVGNTSLAGSIKYLLNSDEKIMSDIQNKSTELNLGEVPTFNTYFMEYMMFE
ncbi:hypothetical protein AN644_04825 [Candidatus Epulonipiscium fishelsonii]|nr:hypothetical protein AN644_04825 [Epulopiscium sp. SCG-C06WGA-EpuloA1]